MLNIAGYGSGSDEDEPALSPGSRSTSSASILRSLPAPVCPSSNVVESELETEVTRKRAWELKELQAQVPPSKRKPAVSNKVKIFLPQFDNVGSDSEEDDESVLLDNKADKIAFSATSVGSTLLSMLPKPACSTTNYKQNRFRNTTLNKIDVIAKKTEPPGQQPPSALFLKPSNVAVNHNVRRTVDVAPSANRPKILAADYESPSESDSEDDAEGGDFFSLVPKVLEDAHNSVDQRADAKEHVEIQPQIYAVDDANRVATTSASNSAAEHPSHAYNLAAAPSEAAAQYQRQIDDWHHQDAQVRRLINANESLDSVGGGSFALPDDLNIVDVSVDSHLGDVRENLLKNLTQQKQKPVDAMLLAAQMAARQPEQGAKGGKGKDKKPDHTAKRKHQITYLAHLAKEREEDLQNQWAQNRQTKRETRMKYGF